MEYIIAGKDSDEKNLKAVVNQLLLLREAANVAYLETSGDKNQKLPDSGSAACHGHRTAGTDPGDETVFDRGLGLCGICFRCASAFGGPMRCPGQNRCPMAYGSENLGSRSRKIKQEKGQDYEDYLQILLWKTSEKTMTYRCMDLIEMNENVKMDNMILQMECFYTYEADPIFVSFCTIGKSTL